MPTLSRRACSPRCGLHSCKRNSAGVETAAHRDVVWMGGGCRYKELEAFILSKMPKEKIDADPKGF